MSVPLDTMSEGTAGWEEVTGHVSDLSWLDDEAVPASWLHDPGQDPGEYSDPAAADRRKNQGRKDTRVEVWDEPSGNLSLIHI